MFYRLPPNLVLRSPWRPYRLRRGERVLTLKAGHAFPPGHPTTRLCLTILAQVLESGRPARLLDVGCGSGILGLAGAALGVSRVVGVDLRPVSARIALDNARANALAGEGMVVIQGSTECLKSGFHLIVANLPPAVQLAKAAELNRLAAPGAALILSGFKDTQEEPVWEIFRQAGWELTSRLTRDEWVAELPPELSFTWVAGLLKQSGA